MVAHKISSQWKQALRGERPAWNLSQPKKQLSGWAGRPELVSAPSLHVSSQGRQTPVLYQLEKYNSRFHPAPDQTGCPDGAGGQLGEEAQHTVVQLLGGRETSVLKDFAQGSNQKNGKPGLEMVPRAAGRKGPH